MNTQFLSLVTTGTTAAIAALLISSQNFGVDAALSLSNTITCLAEAPTICSSSAFFATPSPASMNGTTTYVGGYSFTYDFMTGLENYNGTSLSDLDPEVVAQEKETTLEVGVSIDDDGICIIDVGNETCSTCSTDNCNGGEDNNDSTDTPISVSFDCTNVPNGRASSTCESLPYDGVFYPLMYNTTISDDGTSMSKEDNDESNVEGLDVNGSSVIASKAPSSSSATSTSTCGLLAVGTLPKEGADCTAAMPEGKSTIGCMDMSFVGLTQTDRSCTCDRNDPIWKCASTDTELEPNKSCPPKDQPKASGDSCVGQLSQPSSSMTCMWSQQVSSSESATVSSSISCECKRGATGSSTDGNEVWLCDGTYAPIVNPTLITADTPQEVTTSTTTTTASKEDNDTVDVGDVGVMGTAQDLPITDSSSSSTAAIDYFPIMMAIAVAVVTTTATNF